MEHQQAQQLEQQLRQNWQQIRYRILDQFGEVSPSDLEFARNVNDLIERIADKSHHSERYVETRLRELAGVGGPALGQQYQAGGSTLGQQQAGRPFSQSETGGMGSGGPGVGGQ
ncbi:MAG TPA: hypothetical protein VGP70_13275 [Actinomadura sp.]|jgi:hypothetical protein|nr:hypothetical protein [Actinomadura sp.]